MALKLDIEASVTGVVTKANDLADVKATISKRRKLHLLTGTTAGKADLMFSDTRTLSAAASEELDLAGGLSDPFGAALTFVKVVAIMIIAAEANTNSVVVGGAASNAFTGPFADSSDKVAVPPGGCLLLTAPSAGWTVTAATGDLLKIANSAGSTSVTYDVIIVGRSA